MPLHSELFRGAPKLMGDPDVFSTGFSVHQGNMPNGIDDQFELGSARLPPLAADPNPHHFINTRTQDLIRKNWT